MDSISFVGSVCVVYASIIKFCFIISSKFPCITTTAEQHIAIAYIYYNHSSQSSDHHPLLLLILFISDNCLSNQFFL